MLPHFDAWFDSGRLEAVGVWIEAIALIAIFGLDWKERRDSRLERVEQRKVREEERQERLELREERQRLEGDRKRDDVTCLGVRSFASTVTVIILCNNLWTISNKQAGFAIEKHLHNQLPEYLLRKSEHYSTEIGRAIVGGSRNLLVFKFPYRDYGAVMEDLRILDFGEQLVAWDGNGKPIEVKARPV